MAIEDVNLTGGFFQAILHFSSQLTEKHLESIKLADSTFHFSVRDGFSFVLREKDEADSTREQIEAMIDQLATRFHEKYANAEDWMGDPEFFEDFTEICDEIIQTRPTSQSFPILFRILIKPFFVQPLTQIIPVASDKQDCLYELQRQLTKFVTLDALDQKKQKLSFKSPFVLYLPGTKQLVYVFPTTLYSNINSPTHLFCLSTSEKNFYTFYQLLPLIRKKIMHNSSLIGNCIQAVEEKITTHELKEQQDEILLKFIRETVYAWADINQYIGFIQSALLKELFKAGVLNETFTEEHTSILFNQLLARLTKDIDKVVFGLLTHQQILFVGEIKEEIEISLSTLLAFYPHSSVTFWTEKPEDYLLIGTHPQYLQNFSTDSALIVNLTTNDIIGGQKNTFCCELMEKTQQLAQESSVSIARATFQSKLFSLFVIIKELLTIIAMEEKEQILNQFKALLEKYSPATVHLIAHMSKELNYLVTKNVQKSLGLSGRTINFLTELQIKHVILPHTFMAKNTTKSLAEKAIQATNKRIDAAKETVLKVKEKLRK